MNFKASREALGLTLKEVSVIAGYSIPTINALELEGRGSERLREKLQYVYSLKKDYTPDSEMALREQPVEYKVRDSAARRIREHLRAIEEILKENEA